jgi:hypothetical protein
MDDNWGNTPYNNYVPQNTPHVQQEEEEYEIPTQSAETLESLLHTALAQISQLQECLDKKEGKAPASTSAPTMVSPTAVTIKPQKPDTFDGQRGGLSTDAWLFQLEQYGELTNLDEAVLVQFAATLL